MRGGAKDEPLASKPLAKVLDKKENTCFHLYYTPLGMSKLMLYEETNEHNKILLQENCSGPSVELVGYSGSNSSPMQAQNQM